MVTLGPHTHHYKDEQGVCFADKYCVCQSYDTPVGELHNPSQESVAIVQSKVAHIPTGENMTLEECCSEQAAESWFQAAQRVGHPDSGYLYDPDNVLKRTARVRAFLKTFSRYIMCVHVILVSLHRPGCIFKG